MWGDISSSPSTRPCMARRAEAASIASPCELDTSRCRPRARAFRSTPRISSEKYSPYRSGNKAPTVWVRRVIRLRAAEEGVKRSCSAAAFTRWRVSGVTFSAPLSARDTVATDTPAARATSLIVVAMGQRRGLACTSRQMGGS